MARLSATPGARPGRQARITNSISEPMMTKIARPAMIDARIEPPRSQAAPTIAVSAPATMATVSRCDDPEQVAALPGEREAERHDKAGGSSSAPQVMLKNGAPTVIFSPVNCSSAERIEGAEEHGGAGRRQQADC